MREKLTSVCCALLSILFLAPLAQAQTNRPAGTLVSWGVQVLPYLPPGTRFTAISAGLAHTLLLKNDSSVIACGLNIDHECEVPLAAQSGVVAVAAGKITVSP